MLRAPVVRLVIAIWALVLLILGVAFLVVASVAGQDSAVVVGAATLAPGVLLALVTWVLHARARAEWRRRHDGERVVAEVVRARLHTMTRIGVMLTYTLTVRFAPAGAAAAEFTRQVLAPPTHPLRVGQRIEICYDPHDPENFEPLWDVETSP
jgi:uncharacterized membrane protein HdeD (DUF308 family)